jgi:hypothetical protein
MRIFLLLSATASLFEVIDCEARFRSIVLRNFSHDSHRGFVTPTPEEITRRLVQRENEYAQEGEKKSDTAERGYEITPTHVIGARAWARWQAGEVCDEWPRNLRKEVRGKDRGAVDSPNSPESQAAAQWPTI